jgi:hypothetical protein
MQHQAQAMAAASPTQLFDLLEGKLFTAERKLQHKMHHTAREREIHARSNQPTKSQEHTAVQDPTTTT